MRTGLKVSRGVQLLGAAIMVYGIAKYPDPFIGAQCFLLAFTLIVGARVYEWMTKE